MAFKKLSYHLYNVQVIVKCNHAPVREVLTVHTLNIKVNSWGTEMARMSHVKLKHIKGTATSLADHIPRLKSMGLYDSLNHEQHGKECGHEVFEPLTPIQPNEVHDAETNIPTQVGQEEVNRQQRMNPISNLFSLTCMI